MILVKKIETIEVDRDIYELFATSHPLNSVPVYTNGVDANYESLEVIRELVRGKRFVRPDGKTIHVGHSKQAQEVLGIPYEAWGGYGKILRGKSK